MILHSRPYPALAVICERPFGLFWVIAGMIDAEVNSNGYIVPGLGDAGDRSFGTTR